MSFLVGFAGPTCAGKSLLCSILAERMNAEVVSLDDFLVDKQHYPLYRGHINMDSPFGLKFPEFLIALRKLKSGKSARVPVYDTIRSLSTGERVAKPKELVLCEGFLAFHDPRVREAIDIKIYVKIPEDLMRKRRIERGRQVNMKYFDEVLIPMFRKYGKDAENYADYVIDGTKPPEELVAEVEGIITRGKNA